MAAPAYAYAQLSLTRGPADPCPPVGSGWVRPAPVGSARLRLGPRGAGTPCPCLPASFSPFSLPIHSPGRVCPEPPGPPWLEGKELGETLCAVLPAARRSPQSMESQVFCEAHTRARKFIFLLFAASRRESNRMPRSRNGAGSKMSLYRIPGVWESSGGRKNRKLEKCSKITSFSHGFHFYFLYF